LVNAVKKPVAVSYLIFSDKKLTAVSLFQSNYFFAAFVINKISKMKPHQWAILVATLYLIVYTILVQQSADLLLLSALFAGSSIIIIWVAIATLKAPYHG